MSEQGPDLQRKYPFETTSVGGVIYNVEVLRKLAETIPITEVPLERLRYAVSAGNYYWEDRRGQKLGPFDILSDWEAAQRKDDWKDHVDNIKHAKQDFPIWVMRDGQVFDGMHRLTKAFLDRSATIQARIFDSLPDEAVV